MRNILAFVSNGGLRAAVVAAAAVATCSPASATTTISASAADIKASLSVLTITAGLNLGTASGTTAPAFNNSQTVASVNQSLGLNLLNTLSQGITTGVMTAAAQSDTFTGGATATINNLGLGLKSLGVTSLNIGSSLISSTTSFDGTNLIGSSSISDLAIANLLGSVPIDATLLASTAANRVLVSALGLTVTANEQIGTDVTTGGVQTRSLTTNALRVSYSNYLLGGNLLNGDIIIGQSQVNVAGAVPEAATWMMMIVGFGAIGGALRRSKAKVALLA